VSPLEEHEDFILGLIKEKPDMTLDEIVAAMKKAKIASSRTAVWRFFDRRDITFKKTLYAEEQRRADCARARRRWQREQCMFDPAKLVFIDETCTSTRYIGRAAPCVRPSGIKAKGAASPILLRAASSNRAGSRSPSLAAAIILAAMTS
jgi:hypothetical protein